MAIAAAGMMATTAMQLAIDAFGPIADAIGSRTSKIEWRENLSIEDIVHELDMSHWIGQGLAVALNGERCPIDVHCQQGDEVALLPPVSGG